MSLQPVLIAGQWRAARSSRNLPRGKSGHRRNLARGISRQRLGRLRRRARRRRRSGATSCGPDPPEPDREVPHALRRADRGARGGTRGDGPRGNRAAQIAAAGRRRIAAHHRPVAPGRRRRARRLVGPADDRHEAEHPLHAWRRWGRSGCLGRTIFPSPSTASPAAISRPRIAAGNPVIAKANTSHPGTIAAAGGGGLRRRRRNRPAARHRANDLSHEPRRRRAARRRSAHRRDRLHRQPRRGAETQGGGGRRGQADLSRTFERQSGA